MAVNSFGHKQVVTVTYMETPSRFFVQFDSAAAELADVISQLKRAEEDWVNLKLIEPDVGDLVLAPSPDDLSIYRARIVSEAIEHEELGRNYKCHFIDEGHTNWVPETFLRKIPVDLQQWAPLAHECCLHKAVPTTEDGKWSDKACDVFFRTIEDRDCTLFVFENVGNVLYVDLQVNVEYAPMSVIDALKNLDCARVS